MCCHLLSAKLVGASLPVRLAFKDPPAQAANPGPAKRGTPHDSGHPRPSRTGSSTRPSSCRRPCSGCRTAPPHANDYPSRLEQTLALCNGRWQCRRHISFVLRMTIICFVVDLVCTCERQHNHIHAQCACRTLTCVQLCSQSPFPCQSLYGHKMLGTVLLKLC